MRSTASKLIDASSRIAVCGQPPVSTPMIAHLVQAIPAAVTQAIASTDGERQAFTPMLAILSAQHETQYSRLFRS